MLTEYINAAMCRAHYEILDGDEGYIGKIPGLKGVWANAKTLEACRDQLRDVLEEWIILGLKMNHHIPVIGGGKYQSPPFQPLLVPSIPLCSQRTG